MRDGLRECCVIGGGPAGLVAALSLANRGLTVTLVAPGTSSDDGRTAALFTASVRLLENLGVWDALLHDCAPLKGIRLADSSARLLRTPGVLFEAREIGRDVLGYNVPQVTLLRSLWQRVRDCERIQVVDDVVSEIVPGADAVAVLSAGGDQLHARLVIAADGRRSMARAAAGIDVTRWAYPQTAIVAQFEHSRPHGGVSTEIQDVAGPCTTVPLAGNASSLVWVVAPDVGVRLTGLSSIAFGVELEAKLAGLLGTVTSVGDVANFPLEGLKANVLGRNRVALVGEAGHVLAPVGAQGLNLGFGDAAQIAELAGAAHATGKDPGGDAVLAAFHANRNGDVTGRARVVDALNRTYFSTLLPGYLLRGAGLHALAAIGPLKREVMRRGLAPSPLPALMR